MKVNPKNIIQEGLLLEQAAYNPVTSGDVTNVSWDPCTNSQFMLGVGGSGYITPCLWVGQIDISTYGPPASWTWPVAWGGACDNTSSQVCLAYDPNHGFLTSDGNTTLAATSCNTGCVWGTTLGASGGGMFFEGFECNANNGVCDTVDTGVGTYDTLVICDQNCSGQVTETIGCCIPYTTTNFVSTNVGCENINFPGQVLYAECQFTQCCTFDTGCLDNRHYSNGNPMVVSGSAWAGGTVGTVGGISADSNGHLRLSYDNTTIPYGVGQSPLFGFPDPANLLLGCFQGCNYGVQGGPVSGDWGCLDSTATNYCPTCEADCGTIAVQVPTLETNDPYFTFVNQDWCCTFNEGCMDGGPGFNCGGTVPGTGCIPLWRPNNFQGAACTYDASATVHIEGDCLYQTCAGCMNPIASNYNASATSDNGTCLYPAGCMDPLANNTVANAVADCTGDLVIDGGDYPNANPYSQWPSYTGSGTDQWGNAYIASGSMVTTGCPTPADDCTYTINGCTDVNAF